MIGFWFMIVVWCSNILLFKILLSIDLDPMWFLKCMINITYFHWKLHAIPLKTKIIWKQIKVFKQQVRMSYIEDLEAFEPWYFNQQFKKDIANIFINLSEILQYEIVSLNRLFKLWRYYLLRYISDSIMVPGGYCETITIGFLALSRIFLLR